jgi:hypothetical protein
MAVVNKRPATIVGEQIPSPTSADQRTFFVGEKSTGSGFFEVVTPVQLRPRHCGQSSANNGGVAILIPSASRAPKLARQIQSNARRHFEV